MSQLRAEYGQKIDGIWTVRITLEAGGTKDNEARVIAPPHGLQDLVQIRVVTEKAAFREERGLFWEHVCQK